MSRVRARVIALVVASHPAPCVAVTAMAVVLAARAAGHGIGPVLIAPAILAGQLSVGWSNDAIDAERDAATQRADKPVATGQVSRRFTWSAAFLALAAALALAFAITPATALISAVTLAVAWGYNAGLKATLASGLTYIVAFGLLPAIATSTLPGHPLPHWWITAIAATIGLGAHFANVLPDLARDRVTGVNGLPQHVAARWGAGAVRAIAIALLLAASVALLIAARPSRRWVAAVGLMVAVAAAGIGARGKGGVPFLAAIGIAAVDVALFAAGGETLT